MSSQLDATTAKGRVEVRTRSRKTLCGSCERTRAPAREQHPQGALPAASRWRSGSVAPRARVATEHTRPPTSRTTTNPCCCSLPDTIQRSCVPRGAVLTGSVFCRGLPGQDHGREVPALAPGAAVAGGQVRGGGAARAADGRRGLCARVFHEAGAQAELFRQRAGGHRQLICEAARSNPCGNPAWPVCSSWYPYSDGLCYLSVISVRSTPACSRYYTHAPSHSRALPAKAAPQARGNCRFAGG